LTKINAQIIFNLSFLPTYVVFIVVNINQIAFRGIDEFVPLVVVKAVFAQADEGFHLIQPGAKIITVALFFIGGLDNVRQNQRMITKIFQQADDPAGKGSLALLDGDRLDGLIVHAGKTRTVKLTGVIALEEGSLNQLLFLTPMGEIDNEFTLTPDVYQGLGKIGAPFILESQDYLGRLVRSRGQPAEGRHMITAVRVFGCTENRARRLQQRDA
jgi:hypothetical protein